MAQDFHAAFGLGADDKYIATVDADGIALAAIQGLHEQMEVRMRKAEVRSRQLENKLIQRDAEIAELRNMVAELKKQVTQQPYKDRSRGIR